MLNQVATLRVIVFGASESGRRAIERLRMDPSVAVVAFADNGAGRHGTVFEGCPVISPAQITTRGHDRVVVASHGWRQIVPQLRALGVPADRIELFRLADGTFTPLPAADASRPRLLLLTDDCISLEHGTGALLLRQFADYPRDHLLHAYLVRRGDAALPHSYHVSAGAGAIERGSNAPMSAVELVTHLTAEHGAIDLVYSNLFGDDGLAFLKELASALDRSVPIVHHALDFIVRDENRFDALLKELGPRLTRLWAIGPTLADRLASVTGTMVTVVNPLGGRVSPTWTTEHRQFDQRFSAIVVGNVYTPAVFAKLQTVWAEVRRRYGVGPVKWFAHPSTVQRFEQTGVTIAPDIQYCGFAVGEFLHEQLCAADIAIMPFNIVDEPDAGDPIGRYSVPSRLSEYMNAGVPVFAAAGRSTDAYRFMAGNSVAVCSSLADEARFTADLVAFMRDTALRRHIGASARRFAVKQGDVTIYRTRLLGEFDQLIAASRPASTERSSAAAAQAAVATAAADDVARTARLSRMMTDRIHYACGRRVLDGWLNVDMFDEAYPYGPPDDELRDRIFYADLRAAHPFPDNAFQFAYTEDFLEHVDQADSLIFLSEAYRTLRPGGVLRLSTPALPGILRRHLRSADHAGGAVCREEAYTRWHHLHFYAFETLQLVAHHIGFSKVIRCEYGRSQHPVLEQDSRFDQADLNLVVELTK
jgi:predicted SAM-dependent methyltransferase